MEISVGKAENCVLSLLKYTPILNPPYSDITSAQVQKHVNQR